MNKVLYAVGISDDDVKRMGSENDLGVDINVVESLSETLDILRADPFKYAYVLICVKAFFDTGGKNIAEAYLELAELITLSPSTRFCIIDENRATKDEYSTACSVIPNVSYTSISKIQLRTFKTVLSKFIEGNNAISPVPEVKVKQSVPPKVMNKPVITAQLTPKEVLHPTDKIKTGLKSFTSNFNISKKTGADTKSKITSTIPEFNDDEVPVKNKKPFVLNIKEDVVTPTPEENPVVHPEKQSRNGTTFNPNNFKNKSFLITELTPCGSTMVSLMLAKNLADSGLKVCYVELSKFLSSSNAVFSSEDVVGTVTPNTLSAVATTLNINDYQDYIGIYKGVHIIRDEIMIEHLFTIGDLAKMVNNLNKSFDTVIYDVDDSCIVDYSIIATMVTCRLLVLTNSYSDILKTAIKLKSLIDKGANELSLYMMLTTGSSLVVNKVLQGQSDMDGGTIKATDVASLVADTDDDLLDFELVDLIGSIPISSDVVFNPFSPKAYALTNEILKNLGV